MGTSQVSHVGFQWFWSLNLHVGASSVYTGVRDERRVGGTRKLYNTNYPRQSTKHGGLEISLLLKRVLTESSLPTLFYAGACDFVDVLVRTPKRLIQNKTPQHPCHRIAQTLIVLRQSISDQCLSYQVLRGRRVYVPQ